MAVGGVRDLIQRGLVACLANLGLKLVALVIAVVIFVLVRRSADPPADAEPAPACPP